MLRRRLATALLCALALGITPFDAGAQTTPQSLLEEIYRPYLTQDFKGQSYTQVNRFFAPDLARAIERDVRDAQRRMEVPALDGDPFIDAQDFEIAAFNIAVRDVAAGKAGATVAFKNFGEDKRVELDLVKLKVGWRVADVKFDDGRTLRGLYRKK